MKTPLNDLTRIRNLEKRVDELEDALRFYVDPFAWKRLHDPEHVVQVPDFYRETSVGDTAEAALLTTKAGS
jgi:hypothetical protein